MELDVIGPCPYLDNDVFEDLWLTKKVVASKLLAANLVIFLNELHPNYSNKKFWAEKGFE